MLKVGLLGAGRMGTLHGRNAAAHPRLELARIVDPSAGAAQALAQETGASVSTLADMLADTGIRGVIVASSTDAHLSDTLACLAAGKAVFCEKPLSLDAAALEEARDALVGAGLPPLFVGFNRRFDPNIRSLNGRIEQGEIGRLEALHIVNHDPAPPALAFIPRSGGLFRDFTVHDFDLTRWFVGEPFDELFAFASCLIDPEIGRLGDIDTAKLVLRSASGVLCTISNSRRSGYGYDQRIEAFGSGGALRMDNKRGDTVVQWDQSGQTGAAFPYGFADRYADSYRAELDHFADLIDQRCPPAASFEDSLSVIALADAAEQSVASGRAISLKGKN